MSGKENRVDVLLRSNRKKGLNYLPVPIRWSALVIKVSGQMLSDAFKRL